MFEMKSKEPSRINEIYIIDTRYKTDEYLRHINFTTLVLDLSEWFCLIFTQDKLVIANLDFTNIKFKQVKNHSTVG